MSSGAIPARIPRPRHWYDPVKSAFRIAVYIVCHTAVAMLLIGGIEAIAYLLRRLGEPKLFDVVPLRYCFDAMDACILVVFFVSGVMAAVNSFKE